MKSVRDREAGPQPTTEMGISLHSADSISKGQGQGDSNSETRFSHVSSSAERLAVRHRGGHAAQDRLGVQSLRGESFMMPSTQNAKYFDPYMYACHWLKSTVIWLHLSGLF